MDNTTNVTEVYHRLLSLAEHTGMPQMALCLVNTGMSALIVAGTEEQLEPLTRATVELQTALVNAYNAAREED